MLGLVRRQEVIKGLQAGIVISFQPQRFIYPGTDSVGSAIGDGLMGCCCCEFGIV